MSSAPPKSTPEHAKKARRASAAALAGTSIEWYDFYVFGTAAALVLGDLFFPSDDPLIRTLSALGTFAVGFVLRPVGGILFGYIGDRVSRKTSLLITLLMMGGATTLIGLLPTYDSIGIAAPICLLILRMVQGLSVGGEWGGAVLVASEAAPAHRKALAASMVQLGAPVGTILSTGVFLLIPDESLLNGGWRIPFLLSGLLLVVGLLIRLKLEENEEFVAARAKREAAGREAPPVIELVRRFPVLNICVFVACFAVSGVYIRNVFALNLAVESEGIPRQLFLNALLAGAFAQLIVTPIAAVIADRVTVHRAQIWWTILYLIIAPVPLLAAVSSGNATLIYVAVALSFVGHAAYYSTLSGFLTTLFPTELRFTGISLGYQLSGSLVSAFVPLLAVTLVSAAGGSVVPVQFLYAALIAASLTAIVLAPRVSRRETTRYENSLCSNSVREPGKTSYVA
ncbi:MFS transporter [Rhodococcus sp. NPDC003994]